LFEGLAGVADAPMHELAAVPGMGPARAARLLAALALGRRVAASRSSVLGRPVHSAADVWAWARPRLTGLKQEVFWALALDARHRVTRIVEVAVGSLAGVEVHPREVFRPLIREAAAATLVVHNHPSGSATPAAADLELTERLREAGAMVGIPVLDHIVVAEEGYVSLAERGLV
jgi:DNA repair protein RadC